MKILLTNDDSHDSPLFLMAIELLGEYGELRIVVPAEEQSWKGKSMTRYGNLYMDEIRLHDRQAYSITGTPADCANIGIHNLWPDKPDVVVSGINLGINTGIGFLLASGTVGACLEANIAGLPGLAISQQISIEDHKQWDQERRFSDETLTHLRQVISTSLPHIWDHCITNQPQAGKTWSVNLPRKLQSSQPNIVRTRLGHTYYGQAFSQQGQQFHHDLQPFSSDPAIDTDEKVVRNGNISASLIDLQVLGQDI